MKIIWTDDETRRFDKLSKNSYFKKSLDSKDLYKKVSKTMYIKIGEVTGFKYSLKWQLNSLIYYVDIEE